MTTDRGRCSGHCCEQFSLPVSPEELEANYRRWLSDGEPLGMNEAKPYTYYQDIHLIYPMVVYLGFSEKCPPKVNPTNPGPVHWYTCKHFDPESRDCTIYDIRPQMCRSYPGSAGCNYAECTWHEVKQKPKPEGEVDPDKQIEKPTCAICGRNTANNLSYHCICKKEVCSNCWSYGKNQCNQCVADLDPGPRKAKNKFCDACGQGFPEYAAYTCQTCKTGTFCTVCWEQGKCDQCAATEVETMKKPTPDPREIVKVCNVCNRNMSSLLSYRCLCEALVCSDCWNGTKGQCVKCAATDPTPLPITEVECSICGAVRSIVQTYRCNCGELVCPKCWIEFQCVKCAGAGDPK